MNKNMDLVRSIHIYIAGPLFGIADQVHNLAMEAELKKYPGVTCHLPQIEASATGDGHKPSLLEIANECARSVMASDVVLFNLDGADADSGTAMEVGIGYCSKVINPPGSRLTPIVIGYRTDFRTDTEKEIGVNAMFHLVDKIVYLPSYTVADFKESTGFYCQLCGMIMSYIKEKLEL